MKQQYVLYDLSRPYKPKESSSLSSLAEVCFKSPIVA